MANNEENQSNKRRFKNPETFRERALKAAEQKSKPPKEHTKINWPLKALKVIFRPLKKGYLKLKGVKQLKPLFIVLSFIGRIIFPRYVRTSFEELKKVTWPSFKESRKLTYAVLVFAVIFGAGVATVDWGLGKLFKHLLLK